MFNKFANHFEGIKKIPRFRLSSRRYIPRYLDFQKAFDKVPHQRLIIKLAAHGLDGDVLNWIENWLADRKQTVVINGQCSGWTEVVSGTPQCSVFRPLLFVIYINNTDDSVVGRVLKFADDTKIYHTVNTTLDINNLRADTIFFMVYRTANAF